MLRPQTREVEGSPTYLPDAGVALVGDSLLGSVDIHEQVTMSDARQTNPK